MKTMNAVLCLFATTILATAPSLAAGKGDSYGGSGNDYSGYFPGGHYVSAQGKELIVGSIDSVGGSSALSQKVRLANDKFKDLAIAVFAGYKAMPCASSAAGGAMGVHYVNLDFLKDTTPDIARPQALMYEPTADGRMQLVAVEYIAPKGPVEMEGQLFNLTTAPNRYGLDTFFELHVWAWKQNPAGEFADNNPNVSCAHAMAMK